MRIRLFIFILLLQASWAFGQDDKFQINGAARAYVFANDLNIDEELDSVTTRKANYGQTVLDLGVSIFPNKKTEVIGMFRIRNELGGFWGGGTYFNVRQLTVKGVAGKAVKYELGDVDLEMTPYTLFNFQEEGIVNEADVFSERRDVVHYDLFYKNNSWRMQGANVKFGLQFQKGIEDLDVMTFVTRQRAAGETPERLYGGASIDITQSKNYSLGINSVSNFDLTNTIADSVRHINSVNTFDMSVVMETESKRRFELKGEGGMSSSKFENYNDPLAPELVQDWFYDMALTSNKVSEKTSYTVGYKDVGADFLSPGAQTKRVNYAKFPGLYQQITNDVVGRNLSYADMISGNAENSVRISETLLPYNAAYDNTTPYGSATPNRRGLYLEVNRQDSLNFRSAFVRTSFLQQSRGTGTLKTKNFFLAEAGADFYLSDYMKWKKDFKIQAGIRYEKTSRNGEEFENVDLNSMLLDLGVSYEFAEDLDLLLGAKLWTVNGNAFINERDRYNVIDDFEVLDFDFAENTVASGLRYRFNDDNVLTAQYQVFNINYNDDQYADYGISQFTLLFKMKF